MDWPKKYNINGLEVEVERVFKKDGKTCIELLIEFYEINKVKKENEKQNCYLLSFIQGR